MAGQTHVKWIPRNATAARRLGYVTGNPVTTRLESGVGNCFPGLEMDLRNLERRFFPFLQVDFRIPARATAFIEIVNVDEDAVRAGNLDVEQRQAYLSIARDMGNADVSWRVETITGSFGPLGDQQINIATLDGNSLPDDAQRRPPDPWTAVRLLVENSPVEILAARRGGAKRGQPTRLTLRGRRLPYLDENGAFAAVFQPGELSQSLCSPWTHDFRDCGCFYWASNHPDIALPSLPSGGPLQSASNTPVPWERSDRGTPDRPPAPASASGDRAREMDYYEINDRWQQLDIVLEGREMRGVYEPGVFNASPLPDRQSLEDNLRYAAGVELAVIQEYLAAAYSLDLTGRGDPTLRDDVTSAFDELMRIALSEMRHLRTVNDILRALQQRSLSTGAFKPALRVASQVPAGAARRPVQPRRLEPTVLDEFLAIEQPSVSVDGLYARILVTLEREGFASSQEDVRRIMADGADHFETFTFIKEWLGRHADSNTYLRMLRNPRGDEPTHRMLQASYRKLLQRLRTGYALGLPAGASAIAEARTIMVASDGIQGVCERLASEGLLVRFDPIADDPDFGTVDPPG